MGFWGTVFHPNFLRTRRAMNDSWASRGKGRTASQREGNVTPLSNNTESENRRKTAEAILAKNQIKRGGKKTSVSPTIMELRKGRESVRCGKEARMRESSWKDGLEKLTTSLVITGRSKGRKNNKRGVLIPKVSTVLIIEKKKRRIMKEGGWTTGEHICSKKGERTEKFSWSVCRIEAKTWASE